MDANEWLGLAVDISYISSLSLRRSGQIRSVAEVVGRSLALCTVHTHTHGRLSSLGVDLASMHEINPNRSIILIMSLSSDLVSSDLQISSHI
jgi:hypothetical protein